MDAEPTPDLVRNDDGTKAHVDEAARRRAATREVVRSAETVMIQGENRGRMISRYIVQASGPTQQSLKSNDDSRSDGVSTSSELNDDDDGDGARWNASHT
mmetsp:Transcript_18817/g.40728  ORF Transcript_18817/g.40728 Transcript_18817/m.40728 type:complete len:100 (-) Transcript_18817:2-301(-)